MKKPVLFLVFIIILFYTCGCYHVCPLPRRSEWITCRVKFDPAGNHKPKAITLTVIEPEAWRKTKAMIRDINGTLRKYAGSTQDVEIRKAVLAGGYRGYLGWNTKCLATNEDIVVHNTWFCAEKILEVPVMALIFTSIKIYRSSCTLIVGNCCKYHPSCSRYMEGSIRRYGVRRGVVNGWERLNRCRVGYPGGCDHVK